MIKELATYLAAQASLTVGTTLQTNFFDHDAPNVCSMLREGPGGVGPAGKDRQIKAFQIITRDPDAMASRDQCQSLFDIFNVTGGITLPTVITGESWIVDCITVTTSPQFVRRDEKGRHEFSCNFRFFVSKQ